jgi:hypothetical protein
MSDSKSSSGIAEGTIHPMVFVKEGTLGQGGLLEAGSGDKVIGISFKDTRRSDYIDTTASPGILALVGEPLSYYRIGARCNLQVGAGGCTQGGLLKPGTGGVGVAVAADGDYYGARALATANSGDIVDVEIVIGQQAS